MSTRPRRFERLLLRMRRTYEQQHPASRPWPAEFSAARQRARYVSDWRKAHLPGEALAHADSTEASPDLSRELMQGFINTLFSADADKRVRGFLRRPGRGTDRSP